MPGFDDLSSLFLLENSGTQRHSMGQIVQWNPDTFENVVWWNGTAVTNMKIGNSVDALSYAPGMWVSITVVDAGGVEGVTQAFISGRIIDPGDGAAEEAVAFLRGNLAREISAEIFADRIYSVFDSGLAERNSLTFGDPTNGANVGPVLTDIDIRTGSALIIMSANCVVSTKDNTSSNTGEYAAVIGVRISGATTVEPDVDRVINAAAYKYNGAGITTTDATKMALGNTYVYPITGLNPGLHTFTMKYRTHAVATSGLQADDRSLTVIAF